MSPEKAELARLTENYDRENLSTYETCKYVFELAHGHQGPRYRTADIGAALGVSSSHVRNLVRFYRYCPSDLRQLWKNDRDQRFTFTRLDKICRKQPYNSSAEPMIAEARGVLGGVAQPNPVPPITVDIPPVSPITAKHPAPAPKPRTSASKPAKKSRCLGKTKAKRLLHRMTSANIRDWDQRGDAVLRLLTSMSTGEVSPGLIEDLVTEILQDHGVREG